MDLRNSDFNYIASRDRRTDLIYSISLCPIATKGRLETSY